MAEASGGDVSVPTQQRAAPPQPANAFPIQHQPDQPTTPSPLTHSAACAATQAAAAPAQYPVSSAGAQPIVAAPEANTGLQLQKPELAACSQASLPALLSNMQQHILGLSEAILALQTSGHSRLLQQPPQAGLQQPGPTLNALVQVPNLLQDLVGRAPQAATLQEHPSILQHQQASPAGSRHEDNHLRPPSATAAVSGAGPPRHATPQQYPQHEQPPALAASESLPEQFQAAAVSEDTHHGRERQDAAAVAQPHLAEAEVKPSLTHLALAQAARHMPSASLEGLLSQQQAQQALLGAMVNPIGQHLNPQGALENHLLQQQAALASAMLGMQGVTQQQQQQLWATAQAAPRHTSSMQLQQSSIISQPLPTMPLSAMQQTPLRPRLNRQGGNTVARQSDMLSGQPRGQQPRGSVSPQPPPVRSAVQGRADGSGGAARNSASGFAGELPDPSKKYCHCRKSRCLKRYCDCFSAGLSRPFPAIMTCDACRLSTRHANILITDVALISAYKVCAVHRNLFLCHSCHKKCALQLTACLPCAAVFCDKTFCQCVECENVETSEVVRNVILATKLKDPNAFDPKVCLPFIPYSLFARVQVEPVQLKVQQSAEWKRRDGEYFLYVQVNNSTGSHVKGCKCPKSRCIKKYCECFYANIRCGELCR